MNQRPPPGLIYTNSAPKAPPQYAKQPPQQSPKSSPNSQQPFQDERFQEGQFVSAQHNQHKQEEDFTDTYTQYSKDYLYTAKRDNKGRPVDPKAEDEERKRRERWENKRITPKLSKEDIMNHKRILARSYDVPESEIKALPYLKYMELVTKKIKAKERQLIKEARDEAEKEIARRIEIAKAHFQKEGKTFTKQNIQQIRDEVTKEYEYVPSLDIDAIQVNPDENERYKDTICFLLNGRQIFKI